jgi:hypothetical protein
MAIGTLLESTSLGGPWTMNTAVSPYQFTPVSPQKFYRIVIRQLNWNWAAGWINPPPCLQQDQAV